MAAAAAARALPCSWMAVPCSMRWPRRRPLQIGPGSGPEACQGWLSKRQRKNAPAPPLAAKMLTPTSALGHGEQASIAAQAAQSQGGVGLAGIESQPAGDLRSLRFQLVAVI